VSHQGGIKAVLAAMAANIAIAVMKLIGWLLTGAASMLAEAIHSFADCVNQILILIGSKTSQKPATPLHPFGFGRDRYLSAFLVAIILFSAGGLFACAEAFNKFREVQAGHPNTLLESTWWWVPLVILAGAAVAESLSLRTAVRESRPVKGRLGWFRFIRVAKAPELPVILLEDTAALTGLAFALIGVGMTLLTGSGYWDAAGSAAIGLLLLVVAVILATETRSLLIGEAAADETLAQIEQALTSTPGIGRLIYLKTEHVSPDQILVAAKVAVAPTETAAAVAAIIDAAEVAIRTASPLVGPIYLEPDIWREPGKESA